MAMTGTRPTTLREVDRARRHGHAEVRTPRSAGAPMGGTGGPLPPEVYRRRRLVVAGALIALLVVGLMVVGRPGGGSAEQPVEPVVTAAPAPATSVPVSAVDAGVVDEVEPAACMLAQTEVGSGDTGEAVECAQRALRAAGYYDGEISGTFDAATVAATRSFQSEIGLYVDGIVGRNTATELGVWPGSDAFIVRTPPPPPGATDLWGLPLSSVASAGDDAPPLPEGAGQGSGKRVVYERASQRVWAIDDEERIVRSYLVSGSQYRNEVPGVHPVYSKSEMALGWNLTADLPYMIRYTETERGHIGFHAIPSWNDTGEYLQTEEELGQKLSGGCTRQAYLDAQFLWQFAEIGTKVHVL
jgi:Putative peptidoglycan binding domain/L,D-transpeptidase catalytic domain